MNRQIGNSSKGPSISNGGPTLTGARYYQALSEIGGEPLSGSGFENEEPENGFTQAGEES
jgi:hypothetical protein